MIVRKSLHLQCQSIQSYISLMKIPLNHRCGSQVLIISFWNREWVVGFHFCDCCFCCCFRCYCCCCNCCYCTFFLPYCPISSVIVVIFWEDVRCSSVNHCIFLLLILATHRETTRNQFWPTNPNKRFIRLSPPSKQTVGWCVKSNTKNDDDNKNNKDNITITTNTPWQQQ